jgi:hypothetical protein
MAQRYLFIFQGLILLISRAGICALLCDQRKESAEIIVKGAGNHVFIKANHKYCCIGFQPGRAERGVQSGMYRLKHGFSSTDWDAIHNILRRGEYAFDRYLDTETEIIRHITAAKEHVGFRTMEPSSLSQDAKSARIYNGMILFCKLIGRSPSTKLHYGWV